MRQSVIFEDRHLLTRDTANFVNAIIDPAINGRGNRQYPYPADDRPRLKSLFETRDLCAIRWRKYKSDFVQPCNLNAQSRKETPARGLDRAIPLSFGTLDESWRK